MTTNTGTLSAVLGTLPKLARNCSFLLEEVFSICDGLRMTNNSGMLNAIPGTLQKQLRSWSLLLEEVFSIVFLEFFQNWQEAEVSC